MDEASEDHDEQLFGIVLTTGQELIGYLPLPVKNNVLHVYRPLLAIKHFEQDISQSLMVLHPWSIVSNCESYPISAAHVVLVYPVSKDIRLNHTTVWERSMAMLDDDPPQPKIIGKSGSLSEDAIVVVPEQRFPN